MRSRHSNARLKSRTASQAVTRKQHAQAREIGMLASLSRAAVVASSGEVRCSPHGRRANRDRGHARPSAATAARAGAIRSPPRVLRESRGDRQPARLPCARRTRHLRAATRHPSERRRTPFVLLPGALEPEQSSQGRAARGEVRSVRPSSVTSARQFVTVRPWSCAKDKAA